MKRLLPVAALLVSLAACSDGNPVAPGEPAFASARQSGAGMVEGEFGPGALYAIYRPENWNGDLIVYAHGFIDPAAPIAFPTNDQIEPTRDALLALGYAVAYSSYSENGLAIKDAAQRTHQLSGMFVRHFGRPDRTYLMGHSLGGLVVVNLAERFPSQYDGALAMCGMIGGSQAQVDYIANVRILFDLFYPNALPGTVADASADVDITTVVIPAIVAAISADPTGALAISAITQTPVPFTNATQLVESFIRAIGFNFRGFEDVFGRTHQHMPFDNSETIYTSAIVPAPVLAFVNAQAERYETTPDAAAYLRHFYEPTGELSIPLLTLHNAFDPVVPIFHEALYAADVAAAGSSDLLVQQVVPTYGHCVFGVDRMVEAVTDLAAWVETGVKPAP